MVIRNLKEMQTANDGTRSLLASVLNDSLLQALKDWSAVHPRNCVLIGGIGLSFYVKPRFTQDLDFLFLSENAVPLSVEGFKRTRPHAFEHKESKVEVEVLTPVFLKMSVDRVRKIIETGSEQDGVNVASREGMIVSKLERWELQDQADIQALLESGPVNLKGWQLSDEEIEKIKTSPGFDSTKVEF